MASKNYFTQETEDAIVAYNNSIDFAEKSKIYNEKIHYAFFKLTQNIKRICFRIKLKLSYLSSFLVYQI